MIGASLTVKGRGTAAARYNTLMSKRSDYLERGRDYSQMTLPYIMPRTKNRSGAANKHGYSGIGAESTNHLSNKIVNTLFPAQRAFFTMDISLEAEADLAQRGINKTMIADHMSHLENLAYRQFNRLVNRAKLVNLVKHLIITGNGLLWMDKKEGIKVLGLDQYVCRRSSTGKLMELVIQEEKDIEELPTALRNIVKLISTMEGANTTEKEHKLYTHVVRDGEEFIVSQYLNDVPITEPHRIKEEDSPFSVLRWNSCDSEDYGRGLVEDHSGDFHVIQFLSQARARGAATMMDIKWGVKAGALTSPRALNAASAGTYVQANEGDIFPIQLEKYADSRMINEVLQEYTQRIGRAFMIQSAIRRDAERVTTLELRMDALEVEQSLGGVYSNLSIDLQKPLASFSLRSVDKSLNGKEFEPTIVTGIEGLGKSGELEKINIFMQTIAQTNNLPPAMQQALKMTEFATTVAAQLNLETPWVKSAEELRQENQATQQAEQQQMGAQALAKAGGDILTKEAEQQQ